MNISEIFAPLMPEYSINVPQDPIALTAWIVWFGVLVFIIVRFREETGKINRSSLVWMALLSLLVLGLTPFLGIPIDLDAGSHFDHRPVLHLMFFAAVPWLVAGGILGILPASLLAGFSGLLFSYLETHSIFTPLVFISMALFFTWGVRQRYRTSFFKLLRIPIFSSIFSLILTIPLLFLVELLTVNGEFPLRIAMTLTRMTEILIVYAGMLLVGSVVCIIIAAIFPEKWGSLTPLTPAPGEKSLKNRFLLKTIPILLIMLFVVFGFIWRFNVNSAKRATVQELVNTSNYASEGWMSFINTGLMAFEEFEEDLRSSRNTNFEISHLSTESLDEGSFFDLVAVLSMNGEVITFFTKADEGKPSFIPEDILVVNQINESDDVQIFRVSSETEVTGIVLHFSQKIIDGTGQSDVILWGYTNLNENRYANTFGAVFETLKSMNGYCRIVKSTGKVLINSKEDGSENDFAEISYSTPTYFETASNGGNYMMHYFYPVDGSEWAVVTSAPAGDLYQNVWESSWPIFLFGVGIFAVALVSGTAIFSPVIEDIKLISNNMERMAMGGFDIDFSDPNSKGEVSHLYDRFRMLAESLTNRLQKQADLISLNEQVSSKDSLQESLHTIMDAAIKSGADSVRILLNDTSGLDQPAYIENEFSLAKKDGLYSDLDDEVRTLVHSQGEVILRDFQITRRLDRKKEQSYPSALFAFPMRWQEDDVGLFWVAYQKKKSITTEDIQFVRNLARKATIILARARALGHALDLKNHLKGILDILPDGILLVNDKNQVVYYNHSARSILGLTPEQMTNSQIQPLLNNPSLADFIAKADQNVEPRDFTMDVGINCKVSVYGFEDGNENIVKVVVFQDITQAKKREMLKSEFVTTASHELRSPLTLIHGYAKLLRLTGNLNDQQDTYINNIIEGVEDMKNLVQNLLDIGRLESGQTLEISRISIVELAESVFEGMQPFAKQRNIHLKLLLPDSPIDLDADEIFLAQALKNLIDNAIKFTKMGGDVTLSVRDLEESVIFAVKDTGIGIAPLDQRHLFEKFKHLGNGLGQDSKGSGLGLVIVKSVAERHGGKVWFESQLGRGSTFYLEIPKKYGKNL